MSLGVMKQALELLESAHVATDLVWKRYDCITALRAAIEQAHDWDEVEALQASLREHMVEIHRLRAALEQAQEPVAWMYHGIRHDDTPHERPSLIWRPEYMDVMSAEKGAKATPLYTAPRQWQGLTDEERGITAAETWGSVLIAPQSYQAFARAIEAKLKAKNA